MQVLSQNDTGYMIKTDSVLSWLTDIFASRVQNEYFIPLASIESIS